LQNARNANDPEPFQITGQIPALWTDAAVVGVAIDLAERGTDFADALKLGKAAHREGMASCDRKLFIKAAKAAGYSGVREVWVYPRTVGPFYSKPMGGSDVLLPICPGASKSV
jgi:hypothetical protein